jgi:peptidoglycan biosynthesis/recognition FemAB-like protein
MTLSETRVSSFPEQGVMPPSDNHFAAEVDSVNEIDWQNLFNNFSDANIYQTWPFGVARSGRAGVSHLVVRQGSRVVAVAQARLVLVPALNLGIAYIFWGPLWRRRARATDLETFRRALRALRIEYVARRKMVLRLIPNLPADTHEPFRQILEAEGYVPQSRAKERRTILMDIRPSIEELYRGLHQKWRNCLNKARKQGLELIEGEEDWLFAEFGRIHTQMRERKNLIALTDPALYRRIQSELMPDQKMRVILCKADGEVCAGAICSALGETGIYLFGATSDHGMNTCSSYLVQWRMLEWVKSRGCQSYDLNGISPTGNPGVYRFKSRFAGVHGREVHLLGECDAYPNVAMKLMVATADRFVAKLRGGREFIAHLLR